jgi:hypothetical protein
MQPTLLLFWEKKGSRQRGPSLCSSRVVWLGGLHLAPAPPGSWFPASCTRLSFAGRPRAPSHRPPCHGCDFTAAFSSPACVSHRGCFHFYSRKSRFQAPQPQPERGAPGELRDVRCFVCGGARAELPATALIAVTQGVSSSLGRAGATGPGLQGRHQSLGGIRTSVRVC